ncbi:FkbM family methyltransferase [Methylobacterium sp. P5_C11]
MESQFLTVFKSILDVRESLEGSIRDLKGVLGPGQELHGDQVDFLIYAARRAPLSNAQLMQDLWVLYELGQKRDGYFVELGACDGSTLSNTLLLEEIFGWRGVLAEPARCWQERLRAKRHCYITDQCVYGQGGQALTFNETRAAEYSTIDALSEADTQGHLRRDGTRYEVETVSLRDVLREAGAPRVIDYISLDTEGSEIEILRNFDFSEYDVKLLSVDHNYTSQRGEIYDLLSRNGYRRKFENLSMFDDWYIKIDTDGASPPNGA